MTGVPITPQPNILSRDTPGGSATRGGLAGILAYGITLIAANNGVPLSPELAAAAGGLLAGGLSALIRFVGDRIR